LGRIHLVLLSLIWLALACRDGGTSALPAPTATPVPDAIVIPSGAPLNVGVSVALNGPQRDLGMDLVAAAQLAAGQFSNTMRGHPIVVTPRDDGCSDPEMAANVADEFVADRAVVGVIGPMCTTGAQAANPRYESAGIVHISASATRSELSRQGERYFFRTVWHDDAQAAVQATYARQELGAATAVVLGDGEPYGNALAEEFSARFQDAGGRVLGKLRLERGSSDFSATARQIIEAAPDVIVYEGFNPEGALLARALGEAGFEGIFLGPDGLLNARDFIETAGARSEGATITGGAQPEPAFVESFAALYQRPPTTTFVLQAYDAVTALLKAVDAVAVERDDGSLRIDRAELAEALRSQRFAGLTGSITFDESGERRGETPAELGITVYRVFNAQLVVVE
jgi:branched-chain amino acid transport system substrate-binding protein